MSEVTCYDSNREVLSVIYDPNGNALTHGHLVDLINELQSENERMLDGIRYWSYCMDSGMRRECPEKVDELADFLVSLHIAPYHIRNKSLETVRAER